LFKEIFNGAERALVKLTTCLLGFHLVSPKGPELQQTLFILRKNTFFGLSPIQNRRGFDLIPVHVDIFPAFWLLFGY
jgi:hypothetical protein